MFLLFVLFGVPRGLSLCHPAVFPLNIHTRAHAYTPTHTQTIKISLLGISLAPAGVSAIPIDNKKKEWTEEPKLLMYSRTAIVIRRPPDAHHSERRSMRCEQNRLKTIAAAERKASTLAVPEKNAGPSNKVCPRNGIASGRAAKGGCRYRKRSSKGRSKRKRCERICCSQRQKEA